MLVRCTVTLKKANAPERDDVKNVFHMLANGDTISGSAPVEWGNAVVAFYNGIGTYLSAELSRAANFQEITFAKVSTGLGGAGDDTVQSGPFLRTFTLVAANTSATGNRALPPELAVCLTHLGYQTSPGEGGRNGPRAAARRRGRIYIGPLQANTLAFTGAIVEPAFTAALALGWKTMVTALRNTATPLDAAQVGVYSPTSDTFWFDQSCWVDNAFDTIRSRGVNATLRSSQEMNRAGDGSSNAE